MGTGWLLDSLVIAGYFTVILGIGLYMGRREESLHDFALGGRRIPWWAVLASIIAAETSAGTFFGTPGEGYHERSFTYVQLALGTILARVLVSFIFIKPYYDYNVYSIYEYLTLRFGTGSKNAASAVFLVTRVLASGARIYVAAIALVLLYEMVSGAPADQGRKLTIYVLASVAVVVLTAIYTTLGGIKAVIWTDFIQASIMMGSAVAAMVLLYNSIPGGWPQIQTAFHGTRPLDLFFATGLDPNKTGWAQIKGMFETEYTIFAALFGATFLTMATHGTDQDMVQRMLTAKDIRRSRLSLICSGLADIPIVLIFLSIGILLWVHYEAKPDPGLPQKTNEIFCYYVLHEMPAGMRGLLLAGIFATAMGSLSTALNALATSFTRDWYVPYVNPSATEPQTLSAVRWATVAFSVLMILVSSITSYLVLIRPDLRIIPIVLGIFGYTYGSLLGVFFVGMLTKSRGNDFGNLLGMIVGFGFVLILSGMPQWLAGLFNVPPPAPNPAGSSKLFDWLPVVEFPWRILFGTVATFAVAVCFPSKLPRMAPARLPGEALPAAPI